MAPSQPSKAMMMIHLAGIYYRKASSINLTNTGLILPLVGDSNYGIFIDDTSSSGPSRTVAPSQPQRVMILHSVFLLTTSSVGTITNSGTITASAVIDDAYGIHLRHFHRRTITNSGTITASAGVDDASVLYRFTPQYSNITLYVITRDN